MDKKTVLAVVLSVVIIVIGMVITPLLFPGKTPALTPSTGSTVTSQGTGTTTASTGTSGTTGAAASGTTATGSTAGTTAAATTTTATTATTTAAGAIVATTDSAPPPSQGATIERETDLFRLVFATDGASLTSVQLKKYKNLDQSLVDMVMLPKTAATGELPFGLAFGTHGTAAIDVPFTLSETRSGARSTYTFSRTFLSPTGVPFTLRKAYDFVDGEYLFELRVTIENSVNDFPALDFNGYAYTLTLGPQIGPQHLNAAGQVVNDGTFVATGQMNARGYVYFADNKRQDPKVAQGQSKSITKSLAWTGIVGKYFTAVAVPDSNAYLTVYDSTRTVTGFDRNTISFQRPVLRTAKSTDTFRFYMGPLKNEILSRYDSADSNGFGLSGVKAGEIVPRLLFWWLSNPMKWILDFLARLIPNYGIAIILLTLLTKLVFLPLTFRSSESMAKMAGLNPKMAEIREKMKGKPEQMNQAIAELYRKEKVNPLSGCLPLLLQMPIFIALYNLLNNYFEIRGAMFIPGWIPDLSLPDVVVMLTQPVSLLGLFTVSGLHLLPIVMVATQILSTKFTQPTGATPQGGAQAKLMMYGLPIFFFFLLYEMPSGLVLYWTVQNVLSTAQQLYINWLRARRTGGGTAAGGEPPKALLKPAGKNGSRPALKSGS